MEITPLKKQTEAGVIPGDWDVFRLVDNFKIYAGGDVPKHSLSDTRSEIHPYPIFANALQGSGLYGFTNEKRAKADSVTVTARGYVGHAEYRQEPFFPIVRLLVLEPTGHLDAQFTTFAINERVTFALESTGVPQLTAPQIGKYSIAAPCLKEQRNIAQALSDVDALIAALDRLIAKKRDIKQATMQQLLTGKTRLPGFSGKWEMKRLGDVAEILKGNTLSKSLTTESGSNACILYGELFTTYGRVITKTVSLTNSSEGCLSLAGDVLLPGSTTTTGADLATASALLLSNVSLGGDINVVRRKGDSYDPAFLANHLTHVARKEIAELAQGTTIHHLYGKDLKTLLLKVPPILEQIAIAAVLSDMDAELTVLEARRDKTRAIKQGIMQELLTGKTRLI